MKAELEYRSSGKSRPVLVLTAQTLSRRVVTEINLTAEQARSIENAQGALQ